MKTKLMWGLSLVLVLSLLAACAPAATAPAEAEAPAAEEAAPAAEAAPAEETAEKLFIGHVNLAAFPFINQLKTGYEFACEDFDLNCEYSAPEAPNFESQAAMFEAIRSKKPNGMILNPVPPENWVTLIRQTVDQGIPVVTVDVPFPKGSGASVFVSPDNFEMGKILAEELVRQLTANGVTGGQVVIGICAPANTDLQLRANGYKEAFVGMTEWEIVGPLDTGDETEKDFAFWESALSKYPDAVAFLGSCSFDAPNLSQLKKQKGGDWLVVGFDLEPETMEGLSDGSVAAAMGANPYLSTYVATAYLADHLTSGEPLAVDGWIPTSPELVTAENVQEFLDRENDKAALKQYYVDLFKANFEGKMDSLVVPLP